MKTAAGIDAIVRAAAGTSMYRTENACRPGFARPTALFERNLTIAVFQIGEFSIGPFEVELSSAGRFRAKH